MSKPSSSAPSRSELMGTQSVGKLLWRFSLPGVIAMGVNATYNLVDTVFVGGLGTYAISALTLVFPIQMAMIAIGAGTGIGAASLISRRLGERRVGEANMVVGQTLSIAVIVGGIIALLGNTVGFDLLKLLGGGEGLNPANFAGTYNIFAVIKSNDIQAARGIIDSARTFMTGGLIMVNACKYMIVITSGAVIVFFNIMGNNLIRAEGNPTLPMIAMITGAAINIGLDPVFIYVLGFGVQGAAIATMIARGVGAVIVLSYLFSGRTEYKVQGRQFIPRFRVWGQIYAVGGPHVLMSLVGSISMGIAVKVMSGFGDLYIATYGVLFRLITFGFMPIIGISTGALPIIGYNFGANKYLRVRQTVLRATLVSTAITLGAAVIIILFPRPIASVFNRNKEFLDLAQHAFRFALIGFALVGSQVIFASFFQGIGKGIPAGVIGISRQLLFLVPALLLLANLAEPRWVWLALPIADIGSFILSVIWTSVVAYRIGIGIWGPCNIPQPETHPTPEDR